VQSSTASSITEIERVSQVIVEVSDIVNTIAASIEEQSISSRDIARNISDATQGVQDSNIRVAESAQVSHEIAKNIQVVQKIAMEIAEGSGVVSTSAEGLSGAADQLQLTVSRFKV